MTDQFTEEDFDLTSLCGKCNHYADCYIRREVEEPGLLSEQMKRCTEAHAQDYLEDEDLVLIISGEESDEPDWECDCDENFGHKFPETYCEICGVAYNDPEE